MATKKTSSVKAKSNSLPARRVFDVDTSSRKYIRASYDIARSTDENENLWKYVDSLSAADANSPAVRKTIRNRARYEIANNSYADGILDTKVSDLIGPEIQIQLGDSEISQRVETHFQEWARAVGLWQKVRTLARSKIGDGESFAQFFTNPTVDDRVKLDLKLIECDLVESWASVQNENEIDGIRFDAYNNPISYRVLKSHPGEYRIYAQSRAGEWINRKYIIHYFAPTRPGQVRGVSELVPALSLFGELRLFTKAVLNAASRAAELSGVMQTNLPPDATAAELADPITTIEPGRNAIVSLPEGWTLAQMRAENPSTTYDMFKREIINEIARCLSMPYNIAACDSSRYNYASGRLDHQTYDLSIAVERSDLKLDVLDRIYAMWLEEYSVLAALSPAQLTQVKSHEWHFAGRGHVDPSKEASADDTRLKNGTLTRSRYWAKQGADGKRETIAWLREQVDAEVEWKEMREKAGLDPAPFPGMQSAAKPANETEPAPDKDDGDGDGEPANDGGDNAKDDT